RSRHLRRRHRGRGRQAPARRAGDPQPGRRGRARRRGRRRFHRRGRAPPARLCRFVARDGAGDDRRPHPADPARLGPDGPVLGRSPPRPSAVPVLSSDDPIRVFQRFSTLDALSNGRAEVMLGRGSFKESFPLFGYDLARYEELFNEKLDLFAAVLTQQPVTWHGTLRPPLTDQNVYPKTESGRLKTWIGVGVTPQSVLRAAHYGMPLMLAVIGGDPRRFAPFAELFRSALAESGKAELSVGLHSH